MVTSAPRKVGNLPADVTSFVGRREDVAEVDRLLTVSRLVTVTGVGGVGKTRLALRVAERRQRAFAHGAWLVELASVGDAELVAHTVIQSLLIGEQSGRAPLATLVDFLANRQLLLVLDNCEHLPQACAELAHALLLTAERLTILATSRQLLGVQGEHVWPLAPLPAPDPDQALPAKVSERFAAVELFAHRASAALSEFALGADNDRDAARICYRLDGIPLGIELAAVWLRTLSVPQLAARLDNRFDLLTQGNRTVLPRHQTLLATVEWSHELCSAPERLLWARAAVFAGGFDLPAAEAVCAGEELAPEAVFDAVSGLVDKSVLVRDEHAGQVRYRLLETLREYGLARLREAGEEAALRRAHRNYYLILAEQLDADSFGPRQLEWFTRLHAEHVNLRAALDNCLTEPGQARTGLRMAAALWFYWLACGQLREGRYWLDRVLAADRAPSRERAHALWVGGYVAVNQGDLTGSAALLEECRTLAEQVQDNAAYACACFVLAVYNGHANDLPKAAELYDESLARFGQLGEPHRMETLARLNRALYVSFYVDPARGIELCAELEQVSRERGDLWQLSYTHLAMALASLRLGRLIEAQSHARESLRTKWRFADALGIVTTLEVLAWVAGGVGEHERAAVLLGAAQHAWELFGLPLFGAPHWAAPHEACETQARGALRDAVFETAFRRGSGFSLDEAVAYALGEEPMESGQPAPAAAPATTRLTRREREVATLVAQGLTNKEIAARLVIAPRTAESHLEHIMTKLGFTSRARIASWVATQQDPLS
jgi:predicted ATPase/DNA-binding CsgD family transcriptional regulator